METATRAARAEEDFQIAEWGLVEGGHDVDQADIRATLGAKDHAQSPSAVWDEREIFFGGQKKKKNLIHFFCDYSPYEIDSSFDIRHAR